MTEIPNPWMEINMPREIGPKERQVQQLRVERFAKMAVGVFADVDAKIRAARKAQRKAKKIKPRKPKKKGKKR